MWFCWKMSVFILVKRRTSEFAKSLLGNATLFVNDAFGTATVLTLPRKA